VQFFLDIVYSMMEGKNDSESSKETD